MKSFELKLTKYKALQEELIYDVEKMFYDTCKLKLPEKCNVVFNLHRSYDDEGSYSDCVYMGIYYNDDSHEDICLFDINLSNVETKYHKANEYVADIIEDMIYQFEDEELISNKIKEFNMNEVVDSVVELSKIHDKYDDLIRLACDLEIWGKHGGEYLRC